MVAQVAEKFLACGVLDHGFARIRCDTCTHEHRILDGYLTRPDWNSFPWRRQANRITFPSTLSPAGHAAVSASDREPC
ncbi:MAG: hypothetical protein HEQ38_03195 [Gemmatimonas sp.]|nr:hypothetical protein [Gemmatimonas sp.]